MSDTTAKLNAAADAYIAASTDERRAFNLMAVMEWLSCSYEEDGYSEEQMNQMDIEEASLQFIERRRSR
jgi:hypothetical protein